MDRVKDIGDELYRLPPQAFVAARDGYVAEARNAGDRGLADELATLRRPTVSAWLVNLLALRRAEDVARLLDLGETIRAAQGRTTRVQLRDLSAQRRKEIGGLLTEAVALAAEAGESAVSKLHLNEVESTLTTAMVDDTAARLVQSGRVVKALAYSGFGQQSLPGAVVSPTHGSTSRWCLPPRAVRVPARPPSAAAPPGLRPATGEAGQPHGEISTAEARRDAAQARLDDALAALAAASAEEQDAVQRAAELGSRLLQLQVGGHRAAGERRRGPPSQPDRSADPRGRRASGRRGAAPPRDAGSGAELAPGTSRLWLLARARRGGWHRYAVRATTVSGRADRPRGGSRLASSPLRPRARRRSPDRPDGGSPRASAGTGGGATPAPAGACLPPRAGPVDAGSVLVPGPTNGLSASSAQGPEARHRRGGSGFDLRTRRRRESQHLAHRRGGALRASRHRTLLLLRRHRADRPRRAVPDRHHPASAVPGTRRASGAHPPRDPACVRPAGHRDRLHRNSRPDDPGAANNIVPVYLSSSGTGDDTSWYGEVTFVLE